MKVPTVEKCCCGCNLRLGSAIIGILFAIGTLSETCSSATYAAEGNHDPSNAQQSKAGYITQAVISGIMFVMNLILLWAIHKENPRLMFPWIWVYSFFLFMNTIMFWFLGIVAIFIDLLAGIGFIVLGIFYLAISAYCIIVVYSYFLTLVDMHKPVPVATHEPAVHPLQQTPVPAATQLQTIPPAYTDQDNAPPLYPKQESV